MESTSSLTQKSENAPQSYLIQFCGRTTLRVLPRLSKSKSRYNRILWLSIFFSLLSGAVVCTALILRQYLKFQTRVDQSVNWHVATPFPSVTICPHHPLSHSGLAQLRLQNNTPNIWAERHLSGQFLPKFSYSYFYSSLPNRTYINKIGRQRKNFIFNCKSNAGVRDLNSDAGFWFDCDDDKHVHDNLVIKQVTNSEHFNCYMFTFTNSTINYANGLFFMINLENYRTSEENNTDELHDEIERGCAQCSYPTPLTWKHGVRIAIHEPNTWPDLSEEGHDLAVGSVHDIRFKMRQRRLMQPPYGVCGKSPQLIYRDKGNDFAYSPTVCKKDHLQHIKKKSCGCVEAYFPLADTDEPVGHRSQNGYVYCTNNYFINMTAEYRSQCFRQLQKKHDDSHCPPKCKHYFYDLKLSSSYSFHKSILPRLYQNLRNSNVIPHSLANLNTILKLNRMGNHKKAMDLLQQESSFMDNFLLITVLRSDYSLSISTEEASFTLTSLLSMLGGISSLFIGFNLFVIIEIGELLTILMNQIFRRRFQWRETYHKKKKPTFCSTSKFDVALSDTISHQQKKVGLDHDGFQTPIIMDISNKQQCC